MLPALRTAIFSSTLRILGHPFKNQAMASVEMYHTVHDEWQTCAPIRAMAFCKGKRCRHVARRIPVFGTRRCRSSVEHACRRSTGSTDSKTASVRARGGALPPVDRNPVGRNCERGCRRRHHEPAEFDGSSGRDIGGIIQDFDAVLRVDNQDDGCFVTLRRDLDTGSPQLVSYDKHASFRLSDADISEYDFQQYVYKGNFQTQVILPVQNTLKREEGFPNLVIPQPKP